MDPQKGVLSTTVSKVSSSFMLPELDGETVETVSDFVFWDSKITADGDCTHEIERCLLHGRKAMTDIVVVA